MSPNSFVLRLLSTTTIINALDIGSALGQLPTGSTTSHQNTTTHLAMLKTSHIRTIVITPTGRLNIRLSVVYHHGPPFSHSQNLIPIFNICLMFYMCSHTKFYFYWFSCWFHICIAGLKLEQETPNAPMFPNHEMILLLQETSTDPWMYCMYVFFFLFYEFLGLWSVLIWFIFI